MHFKFVSCPILCRIPTSSISLGNVGSFFFWRKGEQEQLKQRGSFVALAFQVAWKMAVPSITDRAATDSADVKAFCHCSGASRPLWWSLPSRERTIRLMEEIRRSPVDMVSIPSFTGFCTCRAGFFPSTVSHPKGSWEDEFPFPLVGYVSSLQGIPSSKEYVSF